MYIVHNVVADSPVVSYYSCCCYRLFVYRTRIFCTFPSPNRQLSNKNTPNQNEEEQPSKEGRQPASLHACHPVGTYVYPFVRQPKFHPSIQPLVRISVRPSVHLTTLVFVFRRQRLSRAAAAIPKMFACLLQLFCGFCSFSAFSAC